MFECFTDSETATSRNHSGAKSSITVLTNTFKIIKQTAIWGNDFVQGGPVKTLAVELHLAIK